MKEDQFGFWLRASNGRPIPGGVKVSKTDYVNIEKALVVDKEQKASTNKVGEQLKMNGGNDGSEVSCGGRSPTGRGNEVREEGVGIPYIERFIVKIRKFTGKEREQ